MVEECHIVREKQKVGPVGAFEDAGDGRWARLTALGLEELGDSQGLEVDEARRRVLVVVVVVQVQIYGADQRRLLLALEELAEDGGH